MAPERLNRRALLTTAAAAVPSVFVTGNIDGATTTTQNRIILLWLDGGPSQIESFDPKPNSPIEIRGERGVVDTAIPGVQFSDTLPRVSKHSDSLVIVRAVQNVSASHDDAPFEFLSGPSLPRSNKASEAPIQYAAVQSDYNFGPEAAMGSETADLFAGKKRGYPAEAFQLPSFGSILSAERFADREQLLRKLSPNIDPLTNHGLRLLGGDSTDLQNATRITRGDIEPFMNNKNSKYSTHTGTASAFRLAENLAKIGVPFTAVHYPRWDTHSGIFRSHAQYEMPVFDAAVSKLIERTRGEGITVVIGGEFGRTPKVNTKAGRDHWPEAQSWAFTVDKGNGGVHGSTTDSGFAKGGIVTPEVIKSTILDLLGNEQDRGDLIPLS